MGLEEHEARLRHLEQILIAFLSDRDDDTARELAKLIRVGAAPRQFNGKVTNTSTEGQKPSKELLQSQIDAFNLEYDEGAVNSLHGNEIGEYFQRRALLNRQAKELGLDEIPNLRKSD
jgi:hypothetical protein